MTLLLAALAISTALLVLLCLGDPKRRRSAHLPGEGQRCAVRRLVALASVAPGIACAVGSGAAAFLLWLGGYALVGWLMVLAFAGRMASEPRSSNVRTGR
jgi:hypothetical protein